MGIQNLIISIVQIGASIVSYGNSPEYIAFQTAHHEYKKQHEVIHIPTPESVKSLYYTANAMTYEPKRQNLFDLLENTEINSVTIDIKTVSGYTNFDMPEQYFGNILPTSNNLIPNIENDIKLLHDKGVYVIGRIVVFKDSLLAHSRSDLAIKWKNSEKVWSDYKGNSYVDPGSKEVWDYHVNLAQAAYDMGFDEINFDYVRFPTDGRISETYYPFSDAILQENIKWGKTKVIDTFAEYATSHIKKYNPDIVLSADIFGLVTNNTLHNIGQNLESFLLYFDYLGPMIYPSHYGEGFLGYKQPDNHPYEIFQYALSGATTKIDALNNAILTSKNQQNKLSIEGAFDAAKENISELEPISYTKIRPWIQGFSCTRCAGATSYNREKFRKQIEAINDIGVSSWFVWSAGSNYYSERYNKN